MSSISRPLAGPMLTFNLKELVAELRKEEAYERSGRAGRALAKSGRMRLVLVAMAQGNEIGTHQADSPMTLHLLEGDISYKADGATRQLREGDVLFFGPGDAHDMHANRPSALLLTLSAIGDDFNPDLRHLTEPS
jgi:quercetin dioxygenase-like cupin family protein